MFVVYESCLSWFNNLLLLSIGLTISYRLKVSHALVQGPFLKGVQQTLGFSDSASPFMQLCLLDNLITIMMISMMEGPYSETVQTRVPFSKQNRYADQKVKIGECYRKMSMSLMVPGIYTSCFSTIRNRSKTWKRQNLLLTRQMLCLTVKDDVCYNWQHI